MSIKLDKTRDDCCDVFPPENGAHFYMQNGFYFDQNGDVVREHRRHVVKFLDEKNATRLKRLEALDKANEAAKDAKRKALEEAGVDPDSHRPRTTSEANDNEKKVDLKAWLRGKQKIIFPLVQAAIQDQHGVNATSKKQAVDFLVGELGLVEATEVRV
jgi:hypothetical protein